MRFLILILTLVFSLEAKAHKPDVSSTLLVEQSEGNWVLQIRAAMTAFESEINHQYGEKSFATPEEFKQLVIKHITDRVSIQFNEDSPTLLQNGKVNLGHESSVSFDIQGVPSPLQSISVTNSSFSEIPRNKIALMIIKKDFEKNQFTLDNNNRHTAKLKVGNSKFELLNSTKENTSKSIYLFGAALLIFSILYVALRKYKASQIISEQ